MKPYQLYSIVAQLRLKLNAWKKLKWNYSSFYLIFPLHYDTMMLCAVLNKSWKQHPTK